MTFLSNITRNEGDPRILETGPSSLGSADRLARALGWFSIGLGMTELLAATSLSRALGMTGRETLVRAYGVREVAAGLATLSPDKQVGLWSRVAGDGLDILTLMAARARKNPKRDNVGLALTMVLGVTVLDILAAQAVSARHRRWLGERRSYRDRSGFPRGAQAARNAARRHRLPTDSGADPVTAPAPNQSAAE